MIDRVELGLVVSRASAAARRWLDAGFLSHFAAIQRLIGLMEPVVLRRAVL
jgi:hypothetical protein